MTAVLWHLSLQLFCDICLYGGSELLSNASLYLRQLILLLTVERWNWSWESMKKCEQNWKVWTMRSSETSITLQIMAMLLHNHKFQIVLKITWISWLSNFISNSRNTHQHFCILFQRFYNFFQFYLPLLLSDTEVDWFSGIGISVFSMKSGTHVSNLDGSSLFLPT